MRKKINKKHRINNNEPMILIDAQSTENVPYTDTKEYKTIKNRLSKLYQIRKDIDEIIDEIECERIQDLINDLI